MSSPVRARAAIPFAPTAEVLEAAITLLEHSGGSATPAAARRAAFARHLELPIPGGRPTATWRHNYAELDYSGLNWNAGTPRPFPAATAAPAPAAIDADGDAPALAVENFAGLVHVGASPLVRDGATLPHGVIVAPLSQALRGAAVPRPFEALDAAIHGDRFAALAAAFQNCGAYVYVPDGVILEAPIQLVFSSDETGDDALFPQILIVLGAGARASVIERHVGTGRPFVCGIAAAHLGAGAQLDYVVVQTAGEEARLFFSRTSQCGPGARMRWDVAELGGTLVRSVVDARLDHPGARVQTSALFFNTGFQHVDLATTAAHEVGDTISETVVRSAAIDRGQGRYIGNIRIAKAANGSDASLRDDALLLSDGARIDSIPALEIAANQVKAYHGATIGSLDPEQLFYAASRGIARPDAIRMIAVAFFEPAISRFPSEAVRDEIRTALDAKIDAAVEVDA